MPKSTDKTKRTAGAKAPGRSRAARPAKRAAAGTARARAPRAESAATGAAHATSEAPRSATPGASSPAHGASRQQQRAARTWAKTVTIEQYGSGIQCPVRQKRVLRALGLRRPRQRVVRPDNPAIRGMVAAVIHLVRIVETGTGGEGRHGQ